MNFKKDCVGTYFLDIQTEKGFLKKSVIFIRDGEVHIQAQKGKKNYYYGGSATKDDFLYNAIKPYLSEILADFEADKEKFFSQFEKTSYIADRGSLRVKIGNSFIFIPNKYGDGEFEILFGEIPVSQIDNARIFGYSESIFTEGEIDVMADDCHSTDIVCHIVSGDTEFYRKNGKFLIIRVKND